MRLLIIGYPRSGKTTTAKDIARRLGVDKVIHTDTLIDLHDWSELSDVICALLKSDGPWIIEGCSAVRGLRKYLKAGGSMAGITVQWLDTPFVALTGRQRGFAASLTTIYEECKELMR